jgi:putative phosphoribosyl transferase
MGEEPNGAVTLPFRDRQAAGRLLGVKLKHRLAAASGAAGTGRIIVLALPRGGVAVADEVSRVLGAPMDVLVTRKIGYPPQPELGVGAIAEGAEPVYDTALLGRLGLEPSDLAGVAERERAELARRVQVYRGGRPLPDVRGREVVLVDDGLATGVTARAALRGLRAKGAARTILAVPVAPPPSAAQMRREADDVVTLATPAGFHSVGEWYAAFGQLTDADVLALLGRAPQSAEEPRRAP